MTWRKKFIIIMAFGLRLPVVIPAAFRLHYISDEILSVDPTLDGTWQAICTQIEINYGIIAATIPCLRPFMVATATHYGAPASAKRSPNATSQTPRGTEPGFSLGSIPNGLRSATRGRFNRSDEKSKDIPPTIHEVDGTNGNQVGRNPSGDDHHSLESHDSKKMIIRKDVEWSVEFESSKSS